MISEMINPYHPSPFALAVRAEPKRRPFMCAGKVAQRAPNILSPRTSTADGIPDNAAP